MAPRLTTGTVELRRVVITGLGSVNPLGNDVPSSWNAALKGASGIAPIEGFPVHDLKSRIAGQVKGLDLLAFLDGKEARRFDPFLQFAVAAAQEALDDARFAVDPEESDRVGVLVGTGIAGLQTMLDNSQALTSRGPRKVSPFFVPMTIGNMASGVLSIRFGARGPNSCVVTACASGTHAIGDAYRLVQRGEADVMIAGGAEAAVNRLGIAGFQAMRALSTRNDDPEQASRPFDRERDGFVIAEGAGIVVLESLEHAIARAAPVHAELVGYGTSSDAFHLTAPHESGLGAQRAMAGALTDAGLEPTAVDYINAHGTGTQLNDPVETAAIRAVFADHADELAVSSTKSMTGHALGGSGGIETIFTALALRDGKIPPTINLTQPDPECDLDYVANEMREAGIRVALTNAFGFGGTNAVLALARYTEQVEEA